MKRLCEVFRSPKREGMYLYVDKQQGMTEVPDALLQTFGEPESVMTLLLSAERKLARAEASAVLEAIEQHGFYLQMPPSEFSQAGPDGV
jgi:uncharacterized protein YcgL (UPF0745 family)